MSLQLNSVNGSVTLVPEDGTGNANVTVPRGGFSSGLGVGQTWQDMTASRAAGVTYTNTTGRSISISIYCSGGTAAAYTYLYINGVSFGYQGTGSTGSASIYAGTIVSEVIPNGSTYSITVGGTQGLQLWWELR
jgi:hypothetical protein